MRFKQTTKCRSSINKKKFYEMKFSDYDIDKGKTATFEKPHFCRETKEGDCIFWYALFINKKNKLEAMLFHSFDCFEEEK